MPRKSLRGIGGAPAGDGAVKGQREGFVWILNVDGELPLGATVRMPGTTRELVVVKVNDCGAVVREKGSRSKVIHDGRTDEDVTIKENGREYIISARSELEMLARRRTTDEQD